MTDKPDPEQVTESRTAAYISEYAANRKKLIEQQVVTLRQLCSRKEKLLCELAEIKKFESQIRRGKL